MNTAIAAVAARRRQVVGLVSGVSTGGDHDPAASVDVQREPSLRLGARPAPRLCAANLVLAPVAVSGGDGPVPPVVAATAAHAGAPP